MMIYHTVSNIPGTLLLAQGDRKELMLIQGASTVYLKPEELRKLVNDMEAYLNDHQ